MKFKYQAKTQTGELKSGIIDAPSREAAINLLQKLGFFVTSLQEEKERDFLKEIEIFGKISQREVAIFTRQLSVLIDSGVPLSEALFTIASQTSKKSFKEKIFKIAQEVEGGSSLSKALSLYPQVFSSFYVNLIKSGEMIGKLSLCLKYLADYLETSLSFQRKLIGALIYPALVLLVFFGVAFYFIFVLVPVFENFISSENLSLTSPPLIFSVAKFVKSISPLFLLLFLAFLGILIWFFTQESGKRTRDRLLLTLPFINSFFQKIFLARMAYGLSILIAGGIQLVVGLELLADLVGNTVYQKALKEIKNKVKEGFSLSYSLSLYPQLFPPLFLQMISIGERSGKLESVLNNFFQTQQREIENSINLLSEILEPVLILVLGGLTGLLIASVVTSLYRMVTF